MALVSLPVGLYWPLQTVGMPLGSGTDGVIDATTEKFAMIGRLHINGRPGTTKTIDTTGSSSIGWQGGGTAVFDNASTTLDVGIQGVGTTGPTAIPNGTYTVKAVVTTAADATPTLTTASVWHQITPTTGTATLTEGDLIAVVWDMTNRAGSDAINVSTGTPAYGLPTTNAFVAAAWGGAGANAGPNVVITFSDGTIGCLDGATLFGAVGAAIWADASNPDEYGMIFRVPFDCKIDALTCVMRTADAASDFTIGLYSSAEATRVTMASVAVDAAQLASIGSERFASFRLAAEVSLVANTDYCIAVKATGASNLRIGRTTLGNATHRALLPGGTTLRSVTANNGSDFSGSSTTVMYPFGVRISQVQDGVASGGGLLAHPGMRGGMI